MAVEEENERVKVEVFLGRVAGRVKVCLLYLWLLFVWRMIVVVVALADFDMVEC